MTPSTGFNGWTCVVGKHGFLQRLQVVHIVSDESIEVRGTVAERGDRFSSCERPFTVLTEAPSSTGFGSGSLRIIRGGILSFLRLDILPVILFGCLLFRGSMTSSMIGEGGLDRLDGRLRSPENEWRLAVLLYDLGGSIDTGDWYSELFVTCGPL